MKIIIERFFVFSCKINYIGKSLFIVKCEHIHNILSYNVDVSLIRGNAHERNHLYRTRLKDAG